LDFAPSAASDVQGASVKGNRTASVMRDMSSEGLRQVIVVGYDGSEASRAALTLAARRVGREGKMFVVHAYELPPDFLGSPNFERLVADRKGHGRFLLDAMPLTGSELLDTNYETELIGGPPARAIADVARARDADEIIVGARGLGRVRALLGSVSHELLHIADRPVLVIPAAAVEALQRARGTS
jgi:nucleotide-binding universal stress UspA family protein